jgi:hypothetical protein
MTSSNDVLKEIMEQTSNLEQGGQVEETEETVSVQGEQETQPEVEQLQETSPQEETQEASPQEEAEEQPPMRIKYRGKEVDIPADKIREYVQKGYRYEDKVKELNAQLRQPAQSEQIDFTKLDEEFVSELQKAPVKTLMQFTKTILDSSEKERAQQRRIDRAIEKEFSANIPMWDAIREDYQDYRSEGYDPATALKLAQGDFFAFQYFDSKQKGIQEGEKKAVLKQKAAIPSGSKKAATLGQIPSEKDLRTMSSSELAKALGIPFVKHPDW